MKNGDLGSGVCNLDTSSLTWHFILDGVSVCPLKGSRVERPFLSVVVMVGSGTFNKRWGYCQVTRFSQAPTCFTCV